MLAVGDETHDLSREEAAQLRDALSDALTRSREFVRTTCTHREDGTYVVERRAADSAGHRKVFERFETCERLYERLPGSFTAEDVGHTGLTGGRRHMLVWHYAEHPAFDCELVSRQPLTVEKCDDESPTAAADDAAATGTKDTRESTAVRESTDERKSTDERGLNADRDGDHMGVLPADD